MVTVAQRIDYDRIWSAQMKQFDHGSDTARYWDRRSTTFELSCQNSTYVEDLMTRMDLRSEYSLLDVGCGCGAVAIPLARKVNQITALDISSLMLEKLRRRAHIAGLTNIAIINEDWDRVTIGKQIGKHDVVLMSRCALAPLSRTLERINLAATVECYITWHAERTNEFEAEVAEAIGKGCPLYPDYAVICRALEGMGIAPGVELFDTTNREEYLSLQEAVPNMAKGAEIDDGQFANLLSVARRRFTKEGGLYSSTRKVKWALIHWQK